MSNPIRIQQRRIKGWRMPPNTRSVARPSKYGNYVATVDESGGMPPQWRRTANGCSIQSRRSIGR